MYSEAVTVAIYMNRQADRKIDACAHFQRHEAPTLSAADMMSVKPVLSQDVRTSSCHSILVLKLAADPLEFLHDVNPFNRKCDNDTIKHQQRE